MPGITADCAPQPTDVLDVAADASATEGPLADPLGDPRVRHADHLAQRLEDELARGDLTAAVAVGQDLVPLLVLAGPAGALAHHATAELAAALGDPQAALEHFRTAGDRDPESGPDRLPWRSGAALALLRTGDAASAGRLARAEVELAAETGSPQALAGALRTLAAVDTGGGRIQVLLRARAVLADQAPDRLSAQIDTDLAGLLLLSHEPQARPRALALLRAVEAQAARQELWPLHGRVHRLLDRLGESPRLAQNQALALLTPSQRRVARLAADGLTNKQIAAELVVTVKAVEWHLSHVYRKLDITSRADLPATLGAA